MTTIKNLLKNKNKKIQQQECMTAEVGLWCDGRRLPSKATDSGFRSINQSLQNKEVWLPSKVAHKSPLPNSTQHQHSSMLMESWKEC